MMRSSKPSPFTSPAEDTEKPLESNAASPEIWKPLEPSSVERSNSAPNVAIARPPETAIVLTRAASPFTSRCTGDLQLAIGQVLEAGKQRFVSALLPDG